MKPVPQCPTNITAYDPGNIIIGLGISVAVLGAACVVLALLVAYIAREWCMERRCIERKTVVPVQVQESFDKVTGAPSGTHHFDVEKATTSPTTVGSTPELPYASSTVTLGSLRSLSLAMPEPGLGLLKDESQTVQSPTSRFSSDTNQENGRSISIPGF